MTAQLRLAEPSDFEAILAIYNHYIATSTCTFDTSPFTLEQRRPWFEQFTADGRYRLWVADQQGEICGYACSMRFRPKPAYQTSVEVSVYIKDGFQRRGLARALYKKLFNDLPGVHRAYGCITLPNPGSIALHEDFGFKQCAVLEEVGHKFGEYYSVAYYQKCLN